jgi:hypothetical protein
MYKLNTNHLSLADLSNNQFATKTGRQEVTQREFLRAPFCLRALVAT